MSQTVFPPLPPRAPIPFRRFVSATHTHTCGENTWKLSPPSSAERWICWKWACVSSSDEYWCRSGVMWLKQVLNKHSYCVTHAVTRPCNVKMNDANLFRKRQLHIITWTHDSRTPREEEKQNFWPMWVNCRFDFIIFTGRVLQTMNAKQKKIGDNIVAVGELVDKLYTELGKPNEWRNDVLKQNATETNITAFYSSFSRHRPRQSAFCVTHILTKKLCAERHSTGAGRERRGERRERAAKKKHIDDTLQLK